MLIAAQLGWAGHVHEWTTFVSQKWSFLVNYKLDCGTRVLQLRSSKALSTPTFRYAVLIACVSRMQHKTGHSGVKCAERKFRTSNPNALQNLKGSVNSSKVVVVL